MRVSTKGRYALRVMIDLAQHQADGFIPLKDIAQRQDISKKYLEQIVPMLTKSGMLKTTRGYLGGYSLGRKAKDITVGDILRVTEGDIAPVACVGGTDDICQKSDSCMTIGVWKGLNQVINEYLDSINLQRILDENASGNDYCI